VVTIAVLVALLMASFLLFGDEGAFGPNQVALTLAATMAAGIAWKSGHAWNDIRQSVVAGIASALPAIFILFAVGALIGTWAASGTLVAMVYYAMAVLSPNYFHLSACAICALVAVSIGSSWTVAATIGVGLMGVAEQMHLSPEITAGAVISGACFGDKASPLSDTVNLAATAAGAQLFDHIRASPVTSVPALFLALIVFGLLGSPGDFDASATRAAIVARFDVSAWAFAPVIVVLALSVLRVPPFLAILAGALAGVALVTTVVAAGIGMNIVAGDQYLPVVLPGRMFKSEFARRGPPPRLLSRTLGDSATVTAALVPWNSCGAYMSATLGVPAFAYLPFAFFNLLNPLFTILAAFVAGRALARPASRKA
jgi:NhaC family Na+:H+ antiporter